jgi:hypothetical protein
MSIIDELLASQPKEDAILLAWQFQISKWAMHQMKSRGMTVNDVSEACGISIDETRDILTCSSDISLSVLSKLSALFGESVISVREVIECE